MKNAQGRDIQEPTIKMEVLFTVLVPADLADGASATQTRIWEYKISKYQKSAAWRIPCLLGQCTECTGYSIAKLDCHVN